MTILVYIAYLWITKLIMMHRVFFAGHSRLFDADKAVFCGGSSGGYTLRCVGGWSERRRQSRALCHGAAADERAARRDRRAVLLSGQEDSMGCVQR